MKKLIFIFIFLLASLTITMAQSNPSITIVNNTGYEVWYIFISPTTDDSWGSDFLREDQVLPDGESITFQLLFPLSSVNRYDIMLVDIDEDEYKKMNVQIRNNARIVFTFDDIDWE